MLRDNSLLRLCTINQLMTTAEDIVETIRPLAQARPSHEIKSGEFRGDFVALGHVAEQVFYKYTVPDFPVFRARFNERSELLNS